MVNDVTGKLEVQPTVLGEWGKEGVKLSLGEADNIGGGFFSKEFKVKLGSGAKCFRSGLGSRW